LCAKFGHTIKMKDVDLFDTFLQSAHMHCFVE
jgi:hypothetical protein